MKQETPLVGQFLYATCKGEDYGKVVAVGVDGNNVPSIDIEIFDANDLLYDNSDSQGEGYGTNSLAHLDLPKDIVIILRSVQYKMLDLDWAIGIECNTPGNGCYRCTKSFILQNEKTEFDVN